MKLLSTGKGNFHPRTDTSNWLRIIHWEKIGIALASKTKVIPLYNLWRMIWNEIQILTFIMIQFNVCW